MAESKQYCTFYVNELFFGMEVQLVQEVIRFQQMTNVPLAPDVISGLINLRGQIVTAIDLRKRLELPPREDESSHLMNIVIRRADGVISLLVDRVGDVVEVNEESFEEPPDTLIDTARLLIKGAYKMEGQLLLVLDVTRIAEVGLEVLTQKEEMA